MNDPPKMVHRSTEPEQHLKNLGYDEITREIVMSSVFASPLWDEGDRGVMSTKELADAFVANAPEYKKKSERRLNRWEEPSN